MLHPARFYPLSLVLEPSLAGLDVVLQIALYHLNLEHKKSYNPLNAGGSGFCHS